MKPSIQDAQFGSITVDGHLYNHDIVIRLGGKVKKRKKKLSKQKYGTSHTVSLDEAEYIFDEGAKRLIVGTGQHGILRLSEEAKSYFDDRACSVELFSTSEALKVWNDAKGKTIAMFHVTC